jgi:hypothetical protein
MNNKNIAAAASSYKYNEREEKPVREERTRRWSPLRGLLRQRIDD